MQNFTITVRTAQAEQSNGEALHSLTSGEFTIADLIGSIETSAVITVEVSSTDGTTVSRDMTPDEFAKLLG